MNPDNCGSLASLDQVYGMFHSETPLRDTPAARLAVMHAGLLSRISAALLMGCTYARARWRTKLPEL